METAPAPYSPTGNFRPELPAGFQFDAPKHEGRLGEPHLSQPQVHTVTKPVVTEHQPPPNPPQHSITHVTVHNHEPSGRCQSCRNGQIVSGFSLAGWLCGILCFPCGIIVCYTCLREKKCNNCGASAS